MLKWSRSTGTPQQQGGRAGAQGEGDDKEGAAVRAAPESESLSTSLKRDAVTSGSARAHQAASSMEIVKMENGEVKSKSTIYAKRPTSTATVLKRSDSDRSNKSNKSLGTLSAFDPDSAGTLPRATEVTYSMYDDGTDAQGARRSRTSKEIISTTKDGGKTSSTRIEKTSTTVMQNGDVHLTNGTMEPEPGTSRGGKRTAAAVASSAQSTNASIIHALDDLLVDLDDHDRAFDEGTVSLDRKMVSQTRAARSPTSGAGKKVGAFSMRAASSSDQRTVSSSSLHDEDFKEDLSIKLYDRGVSSLRRGTSSTSQSLRGATSGQEIANNLDLNPKLVSQEAVTSAMHNRHAEASDLTAEPNTSHSRGSLGGRSSATAQSTVATRSVSGSQKSTTSSKSAVTTTNAYSVTKSDGLETSDQKSDGEGAGIKRSSRATERESVTRSSVVRTESGRSTSPPQFKVRDIRGSLVSSGSRPASVASGAGDRTSGTFATYSPTRGSLASSSPPGELSSDNIITTSSGRVKRIDSGGGSSKRASVVTATQRTSIVSGKSDAGDAADGTSQRSSLGGSTTITSTRSSVTGRPLNPDVTTSRSSSSASRSVQRTESGTESTDRRSSSVTVGSRPTTEVSEAREAGPGTHVSRSDSRSSSTTSSSVTSYDLTGKPDVTEKDQREKKLHEDRVLVIEKTTIESAPQAFAVNEQHSQAERDIRQHALSEDTTPVIGGKSTYQSTTVTTVQSTARSPTLEDDTVFARTGDTGTTSTTSRTVTSSYNSLGSDRSFRKSASDLLDDFKSRQLGSTPSTLERSGVEETTIMETTTKKTPPDHIDLGLGGTKPSIEQRRLESGQSSVQTLAFSSGSLQSPGSPTVEEAQRAVTPGTVSKLSKDVFANLHLTGRIADASLERARSPDAEAAVVTEGTDKKFKWAVEGVDVPARDDGSEEDGESELHVDVSPTDSASPSQLSPSYDSLERSRRGFSYVKMDSTMAGEIEKRARTVSQKRPHEALETRRVGSPEPHYESLELKEAKAKLHRQIIQSHQTNSGFSTSPEETDALAQSLRDARAKLHKQIVQKKRISDVAETEESEGPSTGAYEAVHVGGALQQTTQSAVKPRQRDRGGTTKTVTHSREETVTVNRVEPSSQKLVTPGDGKASSTSVITSGTAEATTHTAAQLQLSQPKPHSSAVLIEDIGEDLQADSQDTAIYAQVDKSKTKKKREVVSENVIVPQVRDEGAVFVGRSTSRKEINETLDRLHQENVHPSDPAAARQTKPVPQPRAHAPTSDKTLVQTLSELDAKSTDIYSEVRKVNETKWKSNDDGHRERSRRVKKQEVIEEVLTPTQKDPLETFVGQKPSSVEVDETFNRIEKQRSHQTRDDARPSTSRGVSRTTAQSTASELADQLSPDSAYQSSGESPVFVTNFSSDTQEKQISSSKQQLLKPQQPIMVQRGDELVVGQMAAPTPGVSQKMMMKSSNMSSRSSKQMVNGETVQEAQSREMSEKQMQYEHSGRPSDEGVLVTSSRNEAVAYSGGGDQHSHSGGGRAINHPIHMNGGMAGGIMNSSHSLEYSGDVRGAARSQQHSGGGYSATSSEALNNDLYSQQQRQRSGGVTRKASHLSSSSAGSAGQRVVQLRPLTVDVNMANRGGGGPGTPQGPSGMFSPSVKHSQAMYEIHNMTGGSYAPQMNGYSPGQLDNVDYRYSTSSGRVYRDRTPRKYLKVDETRTGKIPMHARDFNYNDIGYRDLEGFQYRRRRPYVARVNLEGDPYFSDFEGASVHSEPMTRVKRRISSRSRQRALYAGGRGGWSSSQPTGLHQIAVGDPVHVNLHPQLGHGYSGSGRLYRTRSEPLVDMAGLGAGGDVLSPTLTDAHQTRRGDYHITLKLNNLGRSAVLDSASTGSYDAAAWGTLGDEASNTWNYRSGTSFQRDPKASVSLVDIELNEGEQAASLGRQPTTVNLHTDSGDGGLQHWFRAYHQHHEAVHQAPPVAMAHDPEVSTTIPRYNTNPPASPDSDAAFSMQVNQTMRMDYKPNEQQPEVPQVSARLHFTISATPKYEDAGCSQYPAFATRIAQYEY